MRIAPPVVLTSEQRAKLETYARGRSAQARVVLRARIVLLAGEGKQPEDCPPAFDRAAHCCSLALAFSA